MATWIERPVTEMLMLMVVLLLLAAQQEAQVEAATCTNPTILSSSTSKGVDQNATFVAQSFQVQSNQTTTLTTLSIILLNYNINETSLGSAEVRPDNQSAPAQGSPLFSFNVSDVLLPSGAATRNYLVSDHTTSTLSAGLYWLVLYMPNLSIRLGTPDVSSSSPIQYVSLAISNGSGWVPVGDFIYMNLLGCVSSPSPSPSPSAAMAVSPLPSPSASLSPGVTPPPQPSYAPMPQQGQIVAATNVTASFDQLAPSVNVSAAASEGSAANARASFSVAAGDLGYNVTKSETQSADGKLVSTTYAYAAQISAVNTTVEQAFTFAYANTSGNFFGLTYDVAKGAVKWSVNLTSSGFASGLNSGLELRYEIASGATTAARSVARSVNKPKANMTTYFVLDSTSSSSSAVVTVEVFDVALIDGAFAAITHDVLLANASSSSSSSSVVLVLRFPAFNETVIYDPSIGLGTLLGSSSDGDGGGGGTSSAVVVGVAVAVPVAVAAVVAVLITGVVVAWWRQRSRNNRGSVNFGLDDDEDDNDGGAAL